MRRITASSVVINFPSNNLCTMLALVGGKEIERVSIIFNLIKVLLFVRVIDNPTNKQYFASSETYLNFLNEQSEDLEVLNNCLKRIQDSEDLEIESNGITNIM